MLDLLLLLLLVAIGAPLLYLVGWACYVGGHWLNRFLWWFFFER